MRDLQMVCSACMNAAACTVSYQIVDIQGVGLLISGGASGGMQGGRGDLRVGMRMKDPAAAIPAGLKPEPPVSVVISVQLLLLSQSHWYRIASVASITQVWYLWDSIPDKRCESPLFLHIGVLEHLLKKEQ